jgi:hypothetical protein
MAVATTGKPTGGYDVARSGGKCAVTGQEIQPDQKYMAALRETPTGFERVDVSMDAWPAFEKKDLLGYWQTAMRRPEAKKKIFVDDEVLAGLFERMSEVVEPAKINFRFVLGLILMRKRLLVYENTRKEGDREIWSMRIKGREDRLDMENPRLDEQQVAEVSQQLGQILNEEL